MMTDGELDDLIDNKTSETLYAILTLICVVGLDCQASNSTVSTPDLQASLPDAPADPSGAPILLDGEDVTTNIQILMSRDALIEEQLRSKAATNILNDNPLREYLDKIGIKSVREG